MKRSHLLLYLEEFLAVREVQDYAYNGLQVEGPAEVKNVVTGVSACAELFERASALGADTVMVHHGILWQGQDPIVRGVYRKRLKLLLDHNLNLIAYHLPLDRHPEIGNNALAARALGLQDCQPFAEVGLVGSGPERSLEELVEKVRETYDSEPLVFSHGPAVVRRVAVLSGGGQKYLHHALELDADAFITGEAGEPVMNLCREGGIHYFAAGHYATEKLGIRALGDYLAEKFDLKVTFVDIPNPV